MAQKLAADRWLFLAATALILIGVVMVYSASAVMASQRFGSEYRFFLQQLVFALLGIGILFAAMNVDYRILGRPPILVFGMILALGSLLAVFIQPGSHGARRWIQLPYFQFQPSEFAKLVLLIGLAWYLQKYGERINEWRKILLPCLAVIGVVLGLILAEPDLGTAFCLASVCAMLLFCARLKMRYFVIAAVVGSLVLMLAITQVSYRRARLESFLNPFNDPLGAGYQARQSIIAIGNGGIIGQGLGEGKQKLFFLPEPHTDFIFAVIGEETGLIGCAAVVMLFGILCWRGFRSAFRAPDGFGFYLGLGLTLMLVFQALINISVTLSLLPTKGITLPYVSKGGSSLLMSAVAAGILLNISQHASWRRG